MWYNIGVRNEWTPSAIRELRQRLDLTQAELGHLLGVSVKTVNLWENGHTVPSKLARLALDRLNQQGGDG